MGRPAVEIGTLSQSRLGVRFRAQQVPVFFG